MSIWTRQQWGARPPVSVTPRPLSEVTGWCVHHTGALVDLHATPSQEAGIVRQVQAWSMAAPRNYWDVDYEALIGPSGTVFMGRDVQVVEAAQTGTWHGRPANRSLLGVAFLGDFTRQPMTAAAQVAFEGLVWITALAFRKAGLTPPADMVTHHYLAGFGGIATACGTGSLGSWAAGPPLNART